MKLLATGRTADVYDLGDGTVLRRYRGQGMGVAGEAKIMRHLADAGFPVPAVLHATGTDLTMEHVAGATLAAAGMAGQIAPDELGRLLAELHRQLDGIAPPHEARSITIEGSKGGVDYGPRRVLHLDLHPENVVLGERGPVVIDWTNAVVGPAAGDRAMTALILAQVAVEAPAEFETVVRAVLTAFLSAGGRVPPEAGSWAAHRRALDPNLSNDERTHLADAAALVTELSRSL